MQSATSMLLGAALVAVGVLVSALADRIRGIRADRREQSSRAPRASSTRAPATPAQWHDGYSAQHDNIPVATPMAPKMADDPRMDDVVSALVDAGFKRPAAAKAAASVDMIDRSDLATWMQAAFRQAGRRNHA